MSSISTGSRIFRNMNNCKHSCKGITDCSLVAGSDILLQPFKYSGYGCRRNFSFLYDYISSVDKNELIVYHHYLTKIDKDETAKVINHSVDYVDYLFNKFIKGYVVYLRYLRLYHVMPSAPQGFDGFIMSLLDNEASQMRCMIKTFGNGVSVNLTFYEFLKSMDMRLCVAS